MECLRCRRQMTDTTEEKSYCMKCDVLVHRPSGVAYTGVPSYDRFIGSSAILFGEKRASLSATLGTEGLILSWTEKKLMPGRDQGNSNSLSFPKPDSFNLNLAM